MMSEMSCCMLHCENGAEFEIRDMSDPDPYSCFTQSCASHVGELFGHRQEVSNPQNRWEVYSLEEVA